MPFNAHNQIGQTAISCMSSLCNVFAKVGGVLAELQAEQARLRQLCSQQGSAMQDLQRQARQAAK